jgi:Tfp pilus assembly protein PilF
MSKSHHKQTKPPQSRQKNENNRQKSNQRQAQPQSSIFQDPKFLYSIMIIIVIIYISHGTVLSAKAISFDDDQYLIKNELVQHPSWSSIDRFFTEVFKPSTVEGYYQPLSMVSLMLDCAMGGKINDLPTFNFTIFHAVNLILHIMNTILIMTILFLLFDNIWAAMVISLLFGIHPMTVEPITWISERKTLLAAFFALGSLAFYITYSKRSQKKFYWASLTSYVLALLSKPTTTTLPLVFLLLDYCAPAGARPLQRLKWKTLIEKIPFVGIGFVSGVITYISQSNTAKTTVYSIHQFVLIFCHNIMFYLSKIFWPINVSSFYPFPKPFDLSQPIVLTGVIVTCVLTILILVSLRWTKAFFTGGLFFVITIIPTMSVIGFNNVIAADKYAYLPLAGLVLTLGWLITRVGGQASRFFKLMPVKIGAVILILLLSIPEIILTHNYLNYWQDSETLIKYFVKQAPQNSFLQNQCGLILADKAKYDEAVVHYKKAINLQPNFAKAYNNLGVALLNQKKYGQAIFYFKEAIRLQPNLNKTYNNIGNILVYQEKYDEAVTMYRKSLEIQPVYANTHKYLGKAFMAQGKYTEAIKEFEEALRIDPYLVDLQKYLNELKAK